MSKNDKELPTYWNVTNKKKKKQLIATNRIPRPQSYNSYEYCDWLNKGSYKSGHSYEIMKRAFGELTMSVRSIWLLNGILKP